MRRCLASLAPRLAASSRALSSAGASTSGDFPSTIEALMSSSSSAAVSRHHRRRFASSPLSHQDRRRALSQLYASTSSTSGSMRGFSGSSGSSSSDDDSDDDDREKPSTSSNDDDAAPFSPPPLPPGASRAEELLHEIETSPRARARYLLTRVLDGKEADALGPLRAADADAADAEAEALWRWTSQFRTQVVDVNRSSKGSPTGGVARFSTMVVAGNANGVLGLGVGKGAEVSDSVRKATAAARGSLFFVPRAARASPLERTEAWYGGVKATVFPLPTGRGLRACPLAAGICRLAGLTDVGVKFHGSRTRRHMVKALFRALEAGPTLADATRKAAAAAAAAGASPSPSTSAVRAEARELAALRKGGGTKKKKGKGGQLRKLSVGGSWFEK